MPSRIKTFRETSILFVIPIPITAKTDTAGMTMPLKMALPAVVPIPPENPVRIHQGQRGRNSEVNTSGIELAIAFIVAPRTPSDRFLPTYSEAVMKPSPALQIIIQTTVISKSGITIPIYIYLGSAYAVT